MARGGRSQRPLGLSDRALLEQYSPLVLKIVGGFQRKLPRSILREDLIGAAMGGLWDAIRRRAKGRAESFEWYARIRIRGAILDELRTQDWLPRRARAAAAEASMGTGAHIAPPAVIRFDELSEWELDRALTDTSSSEAVVEARERLDGLQGNVALLPARERYIVSRHYFHGVKFKDLAVEMDISQPRVSQLHSRAIARLREIIGPTAPLFP